MTGKTLLVGATGFLGSFVAARLAEREPVVLSRPTSDRSVLPQGLEVRVGDLARPLPLDGISTLIYCASMGFGHIPLLMHQLETCGVKRAVFVSTTAIFTSLPSTSRTVRLAAEAAVQTSSLDWTLLRPTMIYGTRRDRNISRLLYFLQRWPVFPVCGNALWQPVYVEDLADAVVAALDSRSAVGNAYNLAGAAPLQFGALVRTAARAVGRRVMLVRVPLESAVLAARLTRVVSAEQIRRLAEDKAFPITDAARDFGFAPRTFQAGVRLEARALGFNTREYADSGADPG
ncbi:MAG: NAD-dependent epimerase/dehydratase family protein [Chloroflexota bacterium]|nr:NAD-dependent epimerase/dehydratase family protein [Chloroflexota bacterium]